MPNYAPQAADLASRDVALNRAQDVDPLADQFFRRERLVAGAVQADELGDVFQILAEDIVLAPGNDGNVADPELEQALSPARERLDAVAATTDGFELSRLDLDQRREGDVLGASQSGFRSSLTMLRVLRDEDTIVAARQAATGLLERDPDLTGAPELAQAVAQLEQSRQSDFMEKA